MTETDQQVDTVVIGGSQSGLAAGYHLARQSRDFVILDAHERVGDAWRKRWDSLLLFTPARYCGLPGMAFPAEPWTAPTKGQVADYLEVYAERFELPVVTSTTVERVSRRGELFEVETGAATITAANVVVATGAYQHPRIPDFADLLDDRIVQFHSKDYRTPDQLADGPVLVVGAANSGCEIALEVARDHETWLSGRDVGEEPFRPGSRFDRLFTPLMWFAATTVTRVTNPIGRKVRDAFLDPPRGVPVGRARRKDLQAAGVRRLGRTTGARDGLPVVVDGTDDGAVVEVANVVWCTGFTTDYSWIDLDGVPNDSYPDHERGVVASEPGLYFLGLLFQYSLSSVLVGGVGRDAEHVADHIDERSTTRTPTMHRARTLT